VALVVPPAAALVITQHPLPDYRCGSSRCAASPATAIMAAGVGRVRASGVEAGARVYSEVGLGRNATITPGPPGAPARSIVMGLDGNPWVLSQVGQNAAVLDVTPHGLVTEYEYPSPEAQPVALSTGFGAAWLVNGGIDRIGVGGELTQFALPGALPLNRARAIVSGPGESMWFTDYDGAVGQITAAGQVLEHSSEPQPLDPLRADPQPTGIADGPDGAIWYTDANHARIGRMTPDGVVEEFPIPRHSPPYAPAANVPIPEGIVAGPEGQYMYFTDPGDNAIGRVSMSGEVTEYPIPSLGPVGPRDITAVGNELVFDEANAAALGTVEPTGSPGEAPLTTPAATSTIAASLGALLKSATALLLARGERPGKGFTVPFASLEAATVVLSWVAERAPAPGRDKRTTPSIRVAAGTQTFDLAGAKTLGVKITAAGERLLKHAPRRSPHIRLSASASFSGYWAGPIEVRRR
jgi:virginiamycin B lyase